MVCPPLRLRDAAGGQSPVRTLRPFRMGVAAAVGAGAGEDTMVSGQDDGKRRVGRPRSADASQASVARRERRERARTRAAEAEPAAGSAAGGGGGSGPEARRTVTPERLALLLGSLDDDVRRASDAVERLGIQILPVAVVAKVLRERLGAERGQQVLDAVVAEAERARRAAGLEGPDVVEVEAVRGLMSAVAGVVAALRGDEGAVQVVEPQEPWWAR